MPGYLAGFDKHHLNGYKYETALLLSIFGGVFGLDRFYLGYVALGCLKMWTVGGMGLWYLLDIILLVNNNLHPADRSNLTHPYYNPGIVYLRDSSLL
ncbi:amyloid-beta binding [Sparganum proliferum]